MHRGDRDVRMLESLVQRTNSCGDVGYDADNCVLHVILNSVPFVRSFESTTASVAMIANLSCNLM